MYPDTFSCVLTKCWQHANGCCGRCGSLRDTLVHSHLTDDSKLVIDLERSSDGAFPNVPISSLDSDDESSPTYSLEVSSPGGDTEFYYSSDSMECSSTNGISAGGRYQNAFENIYIPDVQYFGNSLKSPKLESKGLVQRNENSIKSPELEPTDLVQENENFGPQEIDDLELYDDLLARDHLDQEEGLKKVQERYHNLLSENKTLSERSDTLLKDANKLKQQNTVLMRNISALFQTARLELQRKDEEIVNLRRELDQMVFRRKWRQKPAISTTIENQENVLKIYEKHRNLQKNGNCEILENMSNDNDNQYRNAQKPLESCENVLKNNTKKPPSPENYYEIALQNNCDKQRDPKNSKGCEKCESLSKKYKSDKQKSKDCEVSENASMVNNCGTHRVPQKPEFCQSHGNTLKNKDEKHRNLQKPGLNSAAQALKIVDHKPNPQKSEDCENYIKWLKCNETLTICNVEGVKNISSDKICDSDINQAILEEDKKNEISLQKLENGKMILDSERVLGNVKLDVLITGTSKRISETNVTIKSKTVASDRKIRNVGMYSKDPHGKERKEKKEETINIKSPGIIENEKMILESQILLDNVNLDKLITNTCKQMSETDILRKCETSGNVSRNSKEHQGREKKDDKRKKLSLGNMEKEEIISELQRVQANENLDKIITSTCKQMAEMNMLRKCKRDMLRKPKSLALEKRTSKVSRNSKEPQGREKKDDKINKVLLESMGNEDIILESGRSQDKIKLTKLITPEHIPEADMDGKSRIIVSGTKTKKVRSESKSRHGKKIDEGCKKADPNKNDRIGIVAECDILEGNISNKESDFILDSVENIMNSNHINLNQIGFKKGDLISSETVIPLTTDANEKFPKDKYESNHLKNKITENLIPVIVAPVPLPKDLDSIKSGEKLMKDEEINNFKTYKIPLKSVDQNLVKNPSVESNSRRKRPRSPYLKLECSSKKIRGDVASTNTRTTRNREEGSSRTPKYNRSHGHGHEPNHQSPTLPNRKDVKKDNTIVKVPEYDILQRQFTNRGSVNQVMSLILDGVENMTSSQKSSIHTVSTKCDLVSQETIVSRKRDTNLIAIEKILKDKCKSSSQPKEITDKIVDTVFTRENIDSIKSGEYLTKDEENKTFKTYKFSQKYLDKNKDKEPSVQSNSKRKRTPSPYLKQTTKYSSNKVRNDVVPTRTRTTKDRKESSLRTQKYKQSHDNEQKLRSRSYRHRSVSVARSLVWNVSKANSNMKHISRRDIHKSTFQILGEQKEPRGKYRHEKEEIHSSNKSSQEFRGGTQRRSIVKYAIHGTSGNTAEKHSHVKRTLKAYESANRIKLNNRNAISLSDQHKTITGEVKENNSCRQSEVMPKNSNRDKIYNTFKASLSNVPQNFQSVKPCMGVQVEAVNLNISSSETNSKTNVNVYRSNGRSHNISSPDLEEGEILMPRFVILQISCYPFLQNSRAI